MKKDYLILFVFVSIFLFSGAVIYVLMRQASSSGSQGSVASGQASDQSQAMQQEAQRRAIKQDIERLERRLSEDPNNATLLVSLGNHYYDIREPHKAIEYYQRALAMNPDNAVVLVDCGAMYRQIGQVDTAIAMFKRAIKLEPTMPQAHFNLGLTLRMDKNDPVGAAKAWKRYLELAPNSPLRDLLEKEIKAASGNGR